jgi:hypothetical protein
MLQQEAKEVADKLDKTDFKASNGWLVGKFPDKTFYCFH